MESPNALHPGMQLVIFLGCFLAGGILAAFSVMGLGAAIGIQDLPQVLADIQKGHFLDLLLPIKFLLMISHLAVFAFPAWLFGKIINRINPPYESAFKPFDWRQLVVGIFALFFTFPLVQWTYYLNMQLVPPDASSVDAQEMQKLMLDMPNLAHLGANLLLVGIIAGVGEELFFRGGMQRLIQKLTQNAHLSIWITAIVFSLIHGELQAFIPRMLLGALFGYALLYTGSLWVPMVMHIFFNSIQVIIAYFTVNPTEVKVEDTPDVMLSIIFSMIAAVLYYLFFKMNVSRETINPS